MNTSYVLSISFNREGFKAVSKDVIYDSIHFFQYLLVDDLKDFTFKKAIIVEKNGGLIEKK
jgi:hypothetical protein